MQRRPLLTGVGIGVGAALGGCLGLGGSQTLGAELPAASLEMTARTDAELPFEVLYDTRDTNGRREELLATVADSGTATVETTREPPLPVDSPVAGEGEVWKLSAEVTQETPATSYSVLLDIVQGTVVEARSVAFGDLPTVDREKFAVRGFDEGEVVGIGTSMLYTDEERAKSALVPEPAFDYITWENGNHATWQVDGLTETSIKTYRYTAESSTPLAAYGAAMRKQLGFSFDSLSTDERDIIKQAVDGGFSVETGRTPTAAFESLAARFEGRPRLRALYEEANDDPGGWGRYLVAYDGSHYATRLYQRPSEDATATSEEVEGGDTEGESTGPTPTRAHRTETTD